MQLHGLIHQFPREVKSVILIFIVVLSIGFYGGLSFLNNTTSMQPSGIESNYLGNENDEDAETMKFKKSEREILTIVHNHILSLSVIFFLLSLILATTSIEPFVSVLLTFGGIYFLWSGIIWFKYVIMLSGIFMTLTFVVSTLLVVYQLLFSKNT